MQISLSGHHVDITESLRAYVDTKFERLERHFDHVTSGFDPLRSSIPDARSPTVGQ